ncbi:MAG: methionyl-tRNA formyltransferase [Mariniblastus sp.]|jgi:methionyl-tRNA formyltransferase
MRLIMFGTGPFAVPTFRSLLSSPHEVLALVTRPIADSGKRRKSAENPTRDAGQEHGLPILDPLSANTPEFVAQLESLEPDLFVVCDYGQILSRKCLAASRLGGINLHGSLLPKYRGAAPINWAIFNGDPVTGITIIHMTAKLDGGPCLIKAETPIRPEESAADIEPRLAELGVQPVHDSIALLAHWDGQAAIGELQDPAAATKAPRLSKSDGLIDWSRTAIEIGNQIRAFQPWPGTFTSWHSEKLKQPMRLIIHRAMPYDSIESPADSMEAATDSNEEPLEIADVQPGQVAFYSKDQLLVQTGNGLISILEIQPAGKRCMPVADFLRGKPPQVGDTFA